MSKVFKLLQSFKEQNGCHCLERMQNLRGENIDGCHLFAQILEENKQQINFVFDHNQKNVGNKYADFINKYETEVTFAMCLGCLWHVVSNYNDTSMGDQIVCYN